MRKLDERLEKAVLRIKERVLTYAEDVRTGKQIACQKFIQAVNRFNSDLNNDRYYIDWDEVMRFNTWASMFKHTKGVVSGQKIKLTDWQLFIVTNIFAVKIQSTGYRKYKEAYIQVGRKNTKSQILSIMVSYQAFLSSEQEEIYISCWSRDQSNLVYNEALTQIRQVDILKDKFSDSYNMITVKGNGSIIKPLSNEARKTGEGSNPSMAVLDEYKDNQTDELKSVQKTGMGARPNRLLVVITTAGTDLSYPCYKDYLYYSRILDPETDDFNDEIFIAICELDKDDDVKDESNWIKANPILASHKHGLDFLRSELKIALDQPEKMRAFLTKNMNMWVDQKDNGFLSLKKWNEQEYTGDVGEFLKGASMYYGVDLATTTDLASVGWVAVKGGKFLVGQHSFMPYEKFTERMSRDKIRFDLFRDDGELTLTEGSIIDYSFIKAHLLKMCRELGVREVGFDMWNATHLATELVNEGLVIVEIGQSITKLSEPTKAFRDALYRKDLYHTGDKLLRWAVSNAIVISDPNENIKIDKSRSKDRIDPLAAIINAFARAMFDDQTVDLNEKILSDGWSF